MQRRPATVHRPAQAQGQTDNAHRPVRHAPGAEYAHVRQVRGVPLDHRHDIAVGLAGTGGDEPRLLEGVVVRAEGLADRRAGAYNVLYLFLFALESPPTLWTS